MLTATFSATFDTAVARAAVALQLLDGASQVCGSGTSDPHALTAGQASTFTVAVTSISCASPDTIENLKAVLVGTDSTPAAQYLSGTFAAHYGVRTSTTTATLSGTVIETGHSPLAGARVDVEDGANAGTSATTDAAGHYSLAGLSPGTFTLRASKDGFDPSDVHVTLGTANMTQNFSIAWSSPPPSAPGVLTFAASDPAPGGEVVLSDAGGFFLVPLRIQVAVRYGTSLLDAKLEVELYSAQGQQCGYTFVDQPIAANQPVTVSAQNGWSWQSQTCAAYPVGIASVRATLLTLREPVVNGRLQRTDYATATFAEPYTVRRYPAPPGGAPTPPSISALTWSVNLPVGGDPPIAGDPVSVACTARESDGAPMTITITLTWDGLPPQPYTLAFPAGASSSPEGARMGVGVIAPNTAPAPHARVDCLATNDRGQSARQSTDIGRSK